MDIPLPSPAFFTLVRIPLRFLRTSEISQLPVIFRTTIKTTTVSLVNLQNEDSRMIDSELPAALHVKRAPLEWELLRAILLPVSLAVLHELGTGCRGFFKGMVED